MNKSLQIVNNHFRLSSYRVILTQGPFYGQFGAELADFRVCNLSLVFYLRLMIFTYLSLKNAM